MLALLLALVLPLASHAGEVDVRVSEGMLRGLEQAGVSSFKGIPYARPPVGLLRWRAPEVALPWSGVREAFKYGPKAAQTDGFNPFGAAVGSEDCLTLNVWTPALRPSRKLPVLVFIHGGGGSWGSSSDSLPSLGGVSIYDGTQLARATGAVIVTLNYRLGVFGFLAHPDLKSDSADGGVGNYGLLDQILALKWVRVNIASFGGDPAHVTLWGQSAGGFFAAALAASPLSRGLFSAAIVQSGGDAGMPRESAYPLGEQIARNLGCGNVACLRSKSPSQVLAAVPKDRMFGGFGTVIDGVVLKRTAAKTFAAGEAPRIPIWVSTMADEAKAIVGYARPQPLRSDAEFSIFLGLSFGAYAIKLHELYNPAKYGGNAQAALAALYGDLWFQCPTRRLLRGIAGAAGAWRSVFSGSFSSSAELGGLGASHGIDLYFQFRNLPSGTRLSASEQRLSEHLEGALAAFANTGRPDNVMPWESYSPARDGYLSIGPTPTRASGFRKEECDFWDLFSR